MRAMIAAIFATLTLTAEAYAGEQPMPWELPPEQLGHFLKEFYPANTQKQNFVQPYDYFDEIFCTSKSALFTWRQGTTEVRRQLNNHGKCFGAPMAWFVDGITPHKGYSEIWFINPSGIYRMKLWVYIEFVFD